MNKILFITDNFPPEVNAPATRTYEHCKAWVDLGAEVTVITCFPNFPKGKIYDGYKNQWKNVEYIDGIKIIRVWSYLSPNEGFIKRLLDFNSFALTSFLAGFSLKKDIVISTSPQFFTNFSGYMLSRSKKIKWVLEIRDLWPESLWMLNKNSLTYRLFSWFEYFFYKKADLIAVVTHSFKKTLVSNGINPSKISIFYNGSTFTDLDISNSCSKKLKKELQLDNKIIIGYIGTFGIAQNLPFILKCSHSVSDKYSNLHFLFIGDGTDRERMKQMKKEYALNNVTILPPVPKEKVNLYLSIIDYGLVPLRNNAAYHKVIPSKIFELAAMKIPILLGVQGEAEEILNKYCIGIAFLPENEQDYINKLTLLLSNGLKNTNYADFYQKFNRKIIAINFLEEINKLNDNPYVKN